MTFYYTNCRGLYGKMDMPRALTASRNIVDSEHSLSEYGLLRRDRRVGVHGRVATFIKSTFSHEACRLNIMG